MSQIFFLKWVDQEAQIWRTNYQAVKMPYSLRNLLFVIISGFLLVIATSLTLNQVTVTAHSTHDDVLSVAYELRMAVQKIVVEVSPSGENKELNLRQSMEDVDRELKILKDYGRSQNRPIGDLIIYPTILHENYQSELDDISSTWLSFTTSWDELSKLSVSVMRVKTFS